MAPSALDYTLIQSWLERAYPVASVEWSQAVVDAPQAWPFDASIINTFVRGIRTTDVLGGVDARTHYYGLVSDGGGGFFMRGLASGIPGVPDPSTVASGPTGPNTWGWDLDGSYGDWYTGHEFGHTYGRFHAEFCGAGGGAPYPFVNGQLSNADGAFAGFDTGDPAQGLADARPSRHHVARRHELLHVPVAVVVYLYWYPRPADAGRCAPRGRGLAWRTFRSTRRQHGRHGRDPRRRRHQPHARLRHRAACHGARGRRARARASASAHESAAETRRARAIARLAALHARRPQSPLNFPSTFIADACRDAGDDETGVIDALLPPSKNPSHLELVLNGSVVDTFVAGAPVPCVTFVRRRGRPGAGRRVATRTIPC